MYGKPYHKMPTSSWMIPGGNRDRKLRLIKEQKYPMNSAIQKNLGGPLSEVFFSCLTPSQQDHVGYTPRLRGPGRDLWVSPSDILINKVVLKPPFTNRLKQALTHKGILEIGAEIESKVRSEHEQQLEEAVLRKQREMELEADRRVKEAVQADRRAQQAIYDALVEQAAGDMTKSYQEVLKESMNEVLEEGVRQLADAVRRTRAEMERELCRAVDSRSRHLARQYELQVEWNDSHLRERYDNRLKKHYQECTAALEKSQEEFGVSLKRTITQLEAEHITDMVAQACEKSQKYHHEKRELEQGFGSWFVQHFEKEIVDRDFSIVELENMVRKLNSKQACRDSQIREIFRHFQKFINFALKEKPGQAEFLLSVEQELKEIQKKMEFQEEDEHVARMIVEYIVKMIDDHAKENENTTPKEPTKYEEFTKLNFRAKLKMEREQSRGLKLIGEENLVPTFSEGVFKKNEAVSLANMFEEHPSMLLMLSETLNLNKRQSECK